MENLISVIIPSFNGEKYIKETIESIQIQNFPHEIIVIDDISKDKTVEIAKSMNCKVIINNKHKGQVASKNTGIKEAKGNFWLTIDQDDLLVKNALEILYNEMQKDINNQIIMAQLKDFCSPDSPNEIKYCKPNAYWGILTGSTLFKKEIFNKIGLFREDMITGDVIDLTNRLLKHNIEIKKIPFVSCQRRIHNANYGRTNKSDEYKDYAKNLRERIKLKV